MAESGFLAVFRYLDDFTNAIQTIKGQSEFAGHELFSPTSYHEIEHAATYPSSPVKWFTLIGAMTGTVTGFGLALACDYDWPMIVGGKTAGIPSLPAYVIMGFELTILFGAIATIGGMLIMGKIPNPKVSVLDKRFSNDRFGIFVPHADSRSKQASLLKQLGAEEIKDLGASA